MRKAEAAFNNPLVSRSWWFSRRSLATSATRSSGNRLVTRPSRRAGLRPLLRCAPRNTQLWVPRSCLLPASKYSPPELDLLPSGRLGPSPPDQTSSACSKIFPSTQTEQNLGHFTYRPERLCPSDKTYPSVLSSDCVLSAAKTSKALVIP